MSKIEEALAVVRVAANNEEQATFTLLLAVQGARELGASWRDISRSLGTTPQSAWERFHAKLPVTGEDDPGG